MWFRFQEMYDTRYENDTTFTAERSLRKQTGQHIEWMSLWEEERTSIEVIRYTYTWDI